MCAACVSYYLLRFEPHRSLIGNQGRARVSSIPRLSHQLYVRTYRVYVNQSSKPRRYVVITATASYAIVYVYPEIIRGSLLGRRYHEDTRLHRSDRYQRVVSTMRQIRGFIAREIIVSGVGYRLSWFYCSGRGSSPITIFLYQDCNIFSILSTFC